MTDISHEFPGPNLAYVLDLYDRFRHDPDSVDAATRAYFEQWSPGDGPMQSEPQIETLAAPIAPAPAVEKVTGAANLVRAIREYGHLAARLDPLGSPPPGDPGLDPAAYNLTDEDLQALPAHLVGGPLAENARDAYEAIQALRAVYSGPIGYEFSHLRVAEERAWLQEAAESGAYRSPIRPIARRALLERLIQVEAFEQFLHRAFPGKTRFSIEGLDILVPMLDEVIAEAAEADICTIFVGMAHRGRLNVLAHVLNKPYSHILAEFRDPVAGHNFKVRDDLGWTGDVKYHKGARRTVRDDEPVDILITMPPNPSHLEHVNPVVEGMARAAATIMDRPGEPVFQPAASLPVLIHGDAAFSGQGIVAETLNLSRLSGYTTAGTIHIIANNQLGFTTEPAHERSTFYASDLAKGFNIPIVHVNADDPEACIEAARLAFAFRARFKRDFLIDLIGYRRYGHNEGDEPAFTQPAMYARIAEHPSVSALWARRLVEAGEIDPSLPDEMMRERMQELQHTLESLTPEEQVIEPQLRPPPRGTAKGARTAVPLDDLRALNASLAELQDRVTLNAKLQRTLQRRRSSFDRDDEPGVDWATAEELALASILTNGIPVRLTGQDTARGTFSQRHAVYVDAATGQHYIPLQHLPQACAAFEVLNSPLSENAAVGFEYGYNIQEPGRLVIWEAQYGDFINGAQAVIDEFLVSGRAKWEQTPSMVLLLPHGYEGQGPDHSSARLERFLSLAAELNIRIAYPTTAAQYFHLLRRQALLLQSDPLPLIIMTPKSLLRHRLAASTPRELAEAGWQPVIDDARARDHSKEVRCLVLCSGKVYTDLVGHKRREESLGVAIVRIEQLYPFPADELTEVLERYAGLEKVTWVQEEPENMGAWTYVRPYLSELIGRRLPLHYVGRPPSSSPAEGSSALHAVNQQALVEQAYDLEAQVPQQDIVWVKKA